jgi:MFS family permease
MGEHAELFGRAALVARDPDRFEMLTELHQDERDALIYEREHKWNGPVMLWYSIGLCAIGAATQGWDQTGSNGANLSFPEEFHINKTATDEWIVGIINSIIFLTAGLIGAFIVDPLNHYLGRRGEIFLTALCLTATPIGSAFAKSWQGLFAARFIMGIGIGAKNATVPIYSAEMAPARIRGALVMFWQLWVVIGEFAIVDGRLHAKLTHPQAFSSVSPPTLLSKIPARLPGACSSALPSSPVSSLQLAYSSALNLLVGS